MTIREILKMGDPRQQRIAPPYELELGVAVINKAAVLDC